MSSKKIKEIKFAQGFITCEDLDPIKKGNI